MEKHMLSAKSVAQQAAKAQRLVTHHEKCSPPQHPEDQTDESSTPTPLTVKRQRPESPPRKRQCVAFPDMTNHVVRTSGQDKSLLDVEIAKLFFACNIPFATADHPQFRKVVQMLRPGYIPPTRKAIGGQLLDRVSEDLTSDMKDDIDGKSGTLVQDGWSNIHNEPVVASCLHVNNKVYLLDCHDTGAMTKSADNCKNLASDSIKVAKDKFGCSVNSVVTDNAKNMENMRTALKTDDPSLVVYGCSAHWMNLLLQDITPNQVMKHVIEIQKHFRNHHKPNAWLSEIADSVKPQLPGDTRWKSQLTCLDTFLKNRSHYMRIVQDNEDDFDQQIARKIQDVGIYRNAKDLASQLGPVAAALDRCQGDSVSIADACDAWISLQREPALESHRNTVNKRFQQAVTIEHLVAYRLHPRYQGIRLTAKQLEEVNNWVMTQSEDFLPLMIAFQAKDLPFPPSFFADIAIKMNPVTWWKAVGKTGIPTNFVAIVIKLLSAPASSASIERVFSTLGLIHSKVRNRLGNAKAAKLAFCYLLSQPERTTQL